MENFCKLCTASAEVSCTCDTSLRFCLKDYLFVHKGSKGIHEPINLSMKMQTNQESLLKIVNKSTPKENNEPNDSEPKTFSNETKLKWLKVSKNLQEMKNQLESNFNLFIEGHTSSVGAVVLTHDDKHIISGSKDNTIRI